MMCPRTKEFIAKNAGRSPEEIALMAGRFPDLPMAFIAQQIKGRAKVRSKLPTWFENDEICFPQSLALEQCTSEQVARYRASLIKGGETAIDLTGGFGVDARFLADRFESYAYCERNPELAEVAESNFAVFGLGKKVTCFVSDGIEQLRSLEGKVDLVFVDPARRDSRSYKVSALESCEPDILACWDELLNKGSRVAVKASPGLDISLVLDELSGVESVHVISVENDCKELFVQASLGFKGEPKIHCVNLRKNGSVDSFDFLLSEERESEGEFAAPGRFLCEPNASIMKAGAFKTVSKKWSLKALNPRTRLYGSDVVPSDFHGRVFEILDQAPIGRKEVKRLFPQRKANVISRNSGMSAEELRKKVGLKEGGEMFAIGAAVSGVGRRLYACRLVSQ